MIDDLQAERPDLFNSTSSRFIDLYMKSGLYIAEIAKRLFNNTRHFYNSDDECMTHVLTHQVYGLAPTNILYNITTGFIFGGLPNISKNNFREYNLLDDAKNGTAQTTLNKLFNKNKSGDSMFKFDAVVGNPPYQGANRQQIYVDFYLAGKDVADSLCMIFPSAWQMPKSANGLSKMNTKTVKCDPQIIYINNKHDIFNGVDGAKDVNIILWQRGYNNGLNGKQRIIDGGDTEDKLLLTEHDDSEKPNEIIRLSDIVRQSENFISIQSTTSVLKPYGLRTDVVADPVKYELPDTISKTRIHKNDLRLYAKSAKVYYLPSNYPLPKSTGNEYSYKIFVPYAWGNMSSNHLGGAYSDIIIAKPGDIATETYQEQGCYRNINLTKRHAKYIMTKFVRALLYKNKHSQHSTSAWGDIPLQDFSEPWWDESIDSINSHLFKKYNVPQDIVDFVNDNVQTKTENNIINFNDKD